MTLSVYCVNSTLPYMKNEGCRKSWPGFAFFQGHRFPLRDQSSHLGEHSIAVATVETTEITGYL